MFLSSSYLLLLNLTRLVDIVMCVFVCAQIEHKSLTLGEVLDGDRMALSQYELQFRGSLSSCASYDSDARQFKLAFRNASAMTSCVCSVRYWSIVMKQSLSW